MEKHANEGRAALASAPGVLCIVVLALGMLWGIPAAHGADQGWLKQLERGDLSGAIEGATRALGGTDKAERREQEHRTGRSGVKPRRPVTAPVQESKQRSIEDRRAKREARRAARDAKRPDPAGTGSSRSVSRTRQR